jgi:hypothetical protein
MMNHDDDPAIDPATNTTGRRRFLAGGAIVAAAAATTAAGMSLVQPAGAVPIVGTAFFPLPVPKRVYDSRPGLLPAQGPKTKVTGQLNNISMTGNSSGVPASGVAGVMVSLTITDTSPVPGSFLAIFKNGVVWPQTSNLNWWGENQTLAVTTFTAVDSSSRVALYSSSSTDVIIDVLGWYA